MPQVITSRECPAPPNAAPVGTGRSCQGLHCLPLNSCVEAQVPAPQNMVFGGLYKEGQYEAFGVVPDPVSQEDVEIYAQTHR